MIPALPISAGTLKAVGLAIAVASFLAAGFWGGYRWQAGNVAEAEQARDKAQGERDQWEQNAKSYFGAIEQQKAATAAAVKAEAAQKAKAERAVAEAKAAHDKYEKRLAQIGAGIERDKLNPTCKAELERKVCGSPWE